MLGAKSGNGGGGIGLGNDSKADYRGWGVWRGIQELIMWVE